MTEMIDTPDIIQDNESSSANLPPLSEHSLYQQVETQVNEGNWQAALAPLTELLTLYPQDEHLQEIAASVRTRSALLGFHEEAVAARSVRGKSNRLRAVAISLLIMLGLCVVLGGGAVLFSGWVLPNWQSQRVETRIDQLHEEASSALTSGDYDRAVLAYNGILELRPDDSEAVAGLEEANQLRATASLYSEAIIEMEAHHWEEALALFEQLEGKQPSYADVAERISYIQTQQNLTGVFNKAEAAFSEENYELAIEKYEELQAMDFGFQNDTVQKHLFLSYLQLGLAQEEAAGSNLEKLEEALATLEKAQAIRPKDSQVRGETQLLRSFLSGQSEFEAENWSQAITELTAVYETRPDFADGAAAKMLFEAHVAVGDSLFAKEQTEEALASYEAASAIKGVSKTELEIKITTARVILTAPTPTPTATSRAASVASSGSGTGSGLPAPTATPLPQPFSLKGMSVRNNCNGSGYIHGVVWTAYNMPLPGVQVRALNTTKDIGPLLSNPTNGDGIYQIVINGDQIPGLWMVQVLGENGEPVSEAWGQHLGGECQNGAQELKVDWQRTLEVGN